MQILLLLFLLVALLFTLPAQAIMYKWVDENGKIHYTNSAPPQNAKTLYSSDETGEAPQEIKMRTERENENQAVQARKDGSGNAQDREDVNRWHPMNEAESVGGSYAITIYDIQFVDSMSNWPLNATLPNADYPQPKSKNEIKSPQDLNKYKIDADVQPVVPDNQPIDQMDFQKELDRIQREIGNFGGGAG